VKKEGEPMSAVEREIVERVQALPPDKQQEVLRFVESLTARKKTLLEEIGEVFGDVPDEEWNKLPRDGSENLDHYLYGAPKR
jgi:hypothetical protein